MNNESSFNKQSENPSDGKNFFKRFSTEITRGILITLCTAILIGMYNSRDSVREHDHILSPIDSRPFRETIIYIYEEQKHVLQHLKEMREIDKANGHVARTALSSCNVLRAEIGRLNKWED